MKETDNHFLMVTAVVSKVLQRMASSPKRAVGGRRGINNKYISLKRRVGLPPKYSTKSDFIPAASLGYVFSMNS